MNAGFLIPPALGYDMAGREGIGAVTLILDDTSAMIHGIVDTSISLLFLLGMVRVENNDIEEGEHVVNDLVKKLEILEVCENAGS